MDEKLRREVALFRFSLIAPILNNTYPNKTVKDYLEYLGITNKIGSPREIIQTGYKQGIIEDGESWIKMMLSRNSLSHIYDEKTSREIYEYIVSEYIDLFENLKKKLNEEIL